MSHLYSVRSEDCAPLCEKCSREVAKALEVLGVNVAIEPGPKLRSKVQCSRCTDWVMAEVQSA